MRRVCGKPAETSIDVMTSVGKGVSWFESVDTWPDGVEEMQTRERRRQSGRRSFTCPIGHRWELTSEEAALFSGRGILNSVCRKERPPRRSTPSDGRLDR